MCNTACLEFGTRNLKTSEIQGKDVIEVGALDVNGSLRSFAAGLGPKSYLGVDIVQGPGVDLICDAHKLRTRFGDAAFDTVISTEMLEHVRDWREVISNLKNILKPNGTLLITTRSKGHPIHGFPYDFWRYEIEDMRHIFSDFDIEILEKDPTIPGVFLKARKPTNFKENDLTQFALFSMASSTRVKTLGEFEMLWMKVKYHLRGLAGKLLSGRAKKFIKKFISGGQRKMNVLYLYSGTRKASISALGKESPDTSYYGFNHIGNFGIEASYRDYSDLLINRIFGGVLNFRLKHMLAFFLTEGFDVIFGPSLLYTAFLKKLLHSSRKFVLINLSLTRTLLACKGNRFRFRFIQRLLKEIDGIVCISGVQKDYLDKNYPFLRAKTYFVPLGVDNKYYFPKFDGRKNYILSAGRDNGRDYETVIRAARALPQENFHLVLSERNLRNTSPLPPNVSVFFDLPISELKQKYQEAKLLLLLTHKDDYLDGSDCTGQTVLLDAMASGLPVIVSKKAYLRDYVEEGLEALFVNFHDVSDVVEKIRLLDDPGTRQGLAKNARARVDAEFSTEKMAENLSKIFKTINK